jgi:hypothetical protein
MELGAKLSHRPCCGLVALEATGPVGGQPGIVGAACRSDDEAMAQRIFDRTVNQQSRTNSCLERGPRCPLCCPLIPARHGTSEGESRQIALSVNGFAV